MQHQNEAVKISRENDNEEKRLRKLDTNRNY